MNAQEYKQKMMGELYVQSVVDNAGNPLGWAVAALIDDGTRTEYLVLDHFQSRSEAWAAKTGIRDNLIAKRQMVSNLAPSREIWEWSSAGHDDSDKYWTELDGQDLEAFRDEQYVLRCPAENWHPRPLFPSLKPGMN